MTRHVLLRAVAAVAAAPALIAAIGCGGGGGSGGDSTGGMIPAGPSVLATMESIQHNIFTPKCALAGCHTGPNPQPLSGGGLNLTFDMANPVSANLLNVPSTLDSAFRRVDPGNFRDSYLYMKVSGDPRIAIAVTGICNLTTATACMSDAQCPTGEFCDTTGAQMPRNAPPLTSTELAAIRNWIEGGGTTKPGY